MNLTETRAYLHSYFHPYFEHKKYEAKGQLIFERPTRFGSSVFISTVTGDEERAYIKFFLGIRHDMVENTLTNGFGLSEYFRNSSYTLLANWSDVDNQRLPSSIPCTGMSEVKSAGEWGLSFMDERGFDFLDHYRNLKALDRVFNDRPEISARWASHNYLRCFRAMAIAKIMNRTDFDRLCQMHRQYLESRGFGGAITAKFDATFARIKHLSLN